MESVKIQRKINWDELLGANPKIKNCKEIRFFNELGKQISLTKITKIKVSDQEYIMNYYDSEEVEELQIKNNRGLLLLELKYNKKTGDLKKKVNYDFYKVIIYFLFNFFGERLKDDQEFQDIKECLKGNEIISLQISECSI